MLRGWFNDPYDLLGEPLYDGSFGFGDNYGGHPRAGGAAFSQRAIGACEAAKNIFLDFLTTADTSGGDITGEIIQSHLVPDMRKAFAKFVKEHGCKVTYHKLTRQEQDRINPGRKSLMTYTIVSVTATAQSEYTRTHTKEIEAAKVKAEPSKASAKIGPATTISKSVIPTIAQREPLANRKSTMHDVGLAEASGSGSKKTKKA